MTTILQARQAGDGEGAGPSLPAGTTLVTVAPNGAHKQLRDHPALPLTPYALAQEARRCLDAGAAMIHLHVRTSQGDHLLDAQAYAEATRAIRRAVGQSLVVQVTTEAAGRYAPAQQRAVVQALRPEAASFSIAELLPQGESESQGAAFFEWVRREGIMAQFILYSAAEWSRYLALKQRGVLPGGRDMVLFVLGRHAADRRSEPRELLPFLDPLPPPGLPWSVCAFGPSENACVLTAAALGGHARVGFENNLWLADGRLAPDNAALVSQVSAGLALMGRRPASAQEVRHWFAAAG